VTDRGDNRTDEELYCSCRRPWEGRFMIMCDYCKEWYHGSCVNISSTEALDIDKCGVCRRGKGKVEATVV